MTVLKLIPEYIRTDAETLLVATFMATSPSIEHTGRQVSCLVREHEEICWDLLACSTEQEHNTLIQSTSSSMAHFQSCSQIQINKNAETKKLKADHLQVTQQNLVDKVWNVPPCPVSKFWQSIALRIKLGILQIAKNIPVPIKLVFGPTTMSHACDMTIAPRRRAPGSIFPQGKHTPAVQYEDTMPLEDYVELIDANTFQSADWFVLELVVNSGLFLDIPCESFYWRTRVLCFPTIPPDRLGLEPPAESHRGRLVHLRLYPRVSLEQPDSLSDDALACIPCLAISVLLKQMNGGTCQTAMR
ncbi:hypothetical protein EV421DRAFT_1744925 [Armillaria borealis]|uniref:Uncharacterized protein n=1 Tax=Armillaria borealis TaxID=47425 RepID=A0AA39MCL0_9AGAR|nr:hypothetical protein EV421DRAFT_1744925 [Armillaria borealis]